MLLLLITCRTNASNELVKDFSLFAEKEMKIKRDKKSLDGSKTLIARTLKAEIARQLWLEDGYFQIVNQTDNEVKRAVQFLKN